MEEKKKEGSKRILAEKIAITKQIRAVLCPSWLTVNWLLFAVPVAIAVKFIKGTSPLAVFIFNFLAIIPLAGILSFATEELSKSVGETLAGLLNATFG